MQYTRKFRCRMIGLLLERSFLARFGLSILRPEYFEAKDETLLVSHILRFVQQYKHPPTSPETLLVYAGRDAPDIASIAADAFASVREGDIDFTLDAVREFAKISALRLALLQSIDDIEAGDLDRPLARLQSATRVGSDILDIGLDLMEDVDIWMEESIVPKVPTGFWHVDKLLGGGLSKGELGVVLAPPNRGKSQTLVNIGYGAANLLYGGSVAHFTAEMSRASVLKRYAARAVFRFMDSLELPSEYIEEVIDAVSSRIRGKIRVHSFPSRQATVHDVIVIVEQMIDAKLVDPDKLLIITDYADEFRLPGGMDTRLGLIQLYSQHRAMADYFKCPVWTASQAGRQSLSKRIISIEDFAEAFGKAAVSDVVIAKCETDEEREADEGRLFMAKIRDEAGAGTIITYKHHKESMAMITTGYGTFSDDSEKEAKLDKEAIRELAMKHKARRVR